jgi:hypothetical protein
MRLVAPGDPEWPTQLDDQFQAAPTLQNPNCAYDVLLRPLERPVSREARVQSWSGSMLGKNLAEYGQVAVMS